MRHRRPTAALAFLVIALATPALAASFVLFPKAVRLVSPNALFEVRDEGRPGSASEFVGSFHSLWLADLTNGKSRKLCDYMGVAAVAWSGSNFLLVTEYVGKKTSRALLFPTDPSRDSILLDQSTMIQLVPVELRAALRDNDHVFVEASHFESETFYFRVWGYGGHDPSGFRWNCQYALLDGIVACSPERETTFTR